MIENGGISTNNNNINTSFHGEEPPPDPNDFGTREEEIRNRELLEHLLEQQKKRREIVDRLTKEEQVKKELEKERRMRELVSQKAYYLRRNASAKDKSKAYNDRIKQMIEKVDEYMRKISKLDSIAQIKDQAQKEFEEEILNAKKKKRKLTKKEIEHLTKTNEINRKLREENKKKIEERKKNDILKKEKSKKEEEKKKRIERILKYGYKLPKAGDETNKEEVNIRSGGLGIFQEEGNVIGTNLSPNMINNGNINGNKNKRPNSSYRMGKLELNKINNQKEINPEEKLKEILKKDPYNLNELLKFQKKYKYIEIGPYIHKAKMKQINQNKNKHKHKSRAIPSTNKITNNINENGESNKILFQEEEIGSGDNLVNSGEEENENDVEEENDDENNEDENNNEKVEDTPVNNDDKENGVNPDENNDRKRSKSKGKKSKKKKKKIKKNKIKKKKININENYLDACKYNNDTCIKSILLNAKNDEEVYKRVNERDEYGRNGLMYLLIHNNANMIKLNLLSGVTLGDYKDIYGRNLIHYCCTEIVDKSMLDIICHCIDFKKFGELCSYVNKCIPITKRENNDIFSEEFQKQCEEKIKDFDELIKTKENGSENKNNVNNYNNLKEKIVNISKMVNSPDRDGNYPIHYLANNNDMEKMEILMYYHANLDVLDREGNKPIDLTTNEVIQQYLLKNEKNSKSKKNSNNNNTSINGAEPLNKSNISINLTSLDIETIKYYSPEKINSFFFGVENNTYLILSVIQKNYKLFKYLITEKNAKVDYVNGNGWTILFFIITNQLWTYFAFLFDLPNPENCNTPEKIYSELKNKVFEKTSLMETNGDLTYLGQAIKIIDNLSNKNENILSICIDEFNDIFILKSLILLYEINIKYFAMNTPKNIVFQRQYGKFDESSYINIIFNRQYGKNKETILIKYTKKKDLKALKYLLDILCRKEKKLNLDIYKGDCNNQNILHHAVLLKQKEIIKYLIKYDSDTNLLKTNKDSKGKTPVNLDRTKTYEYEFTTVWDAAKRNDTKLLNKLIKELKYYEVNEQTYINKNTPLHSAIEYKAERSILYLLKEGADKNKKNVNGHTPLDVIEKVKFRDEKWIKFVKKLLNGEIKDFHELDKIEVDKFIQDKKNITNKKFEDKNKFNQGLAQDMKLLEILSQIKEQIIKKKIDIKDLFNELDKNKNGELSLDEFKKLFTKLDLQDIKDDDMFCILAYIDTNEDSKLKYKEFMNLLT